MKYLLFCFSLFICFTANADVVGYKKEIDYVENMFISVGRPYNVKVIVKGVEKNIIAKRRKMNIPLDSL